MTGYGDNVVYLTNVPQMNFYWPDAALYYNNGALCGSTFTYPSTYYDMSRYNTLYNIFCRLLYFCCAVFWYDTSMSETAQKILHINPIYDFIYYSRMVIIHQQIPTLFDHLVLLGYTILFLGLGILIYRCNKDKFVYYL